MMVQMSQPSFFHFPSSNVPATDVRAGIEGLELLPHRSEFVDEDDEMRG